MKRFFAIRKSESIPISGYRFFNEAIEQITLYIMRYYMRLRPHRYNVGLTHNESERLYWKNSNTIATFSDLCKVANEGKAIKSA